MAPKGQIAENFHATCVAWDGQGVLIIGPSGAGKSSLALELMGFGAILVADDRTDLRLVDEQVIASSPPEIHGQIEARGVGILAAETTANAPVRLVVDMGVKEPDRLPQLHSKAILGQTIPLLNSSGHAGFAAALWQYLKGGRIQ